MRRFPLPRLLLVAFIWIVVTQMGFGLVTAMVVTFFVVLGLNILGAIAGMFNRRRA